jgi:HupE / UreJ protein
LADGKKVVNTVVNRSLWRTGIAAFCLSLGSLLPAYAHKASDAYLLLGAPNTTQASGSMVLQLSVALRDLDAAIDSLDIDNDRALTWGEIKRAVPAMQSLVEQAVDLRCDSKPLQLNWVFESLEQRSDGTYARLAAPAWCAVHAALALEYRLLKNIDPTHRLLVGGTLEQQAVASVIAPHVATLLNLRGAGAGTEPGGNAAFAQTPGDVFSKFLIEGLHHIATGFDHLAFLLALMLPIVLLRSVQATTLAQVGHPGVWALVRTVTGFTIGHSITLAMASLGWLTAPRWIEPAIAITIGIAACLNLYPQRWLRGDLLALLFGLIHGVAFSEVIREAGIGGASLLWALAGFNVGVELGQLLGVALWCAVHVQLVRWQGYERWVVRAGSWALLLLALVWFTQRLAT